MDEPVEYIVAPDVQTAFDDLHDALESDFMADDWSIEVRAAMDRLCAVMDKLRHTLDGGSVQ